jgi:hypothetical protein
MLPFDSYVQKSLGNRQLRSEAERQLYWSTYQKMAYQAPAPRRRSSVWMGVRGLLEAPRRWWHECVQSDMRVSEEGSPTHPLISKEGRV